MTLTNTTSPFRLRRAEKMVQAELVATYCPPLKKANLLDERSTIVLGARGSGKSTVLRYLCDPSSRHALQTAPDGRPVVAAYVSFARHWVAGLQSRSWVDPAASEAIFTFSFNLLMANAFIEPIRSMLAEVHRKNDVRAIEERNLARHIVALFTNTDAPASLDDAGSVLRRLERDARAQPLRMLQEHTSLLPKGWRQDELFEPIEEIVRYVQDRGKADLLWILAFDELDNLELSQQRYFNTVLRNASAPIAIKAACLPHGHRTLETLTPGNPVLPTEDFDYVALTYSPSDPRTLEFCRQLYQKRVAYWRDALDQSSLPDDPDAWLGESTLASRSTSALSAEFGTSEPAAAVAAEFARLGQEVSENTDSLRQYEPVVAIRALRRQSRGNQASAVYAGWRDLVAVADGNPRKLLRLLDSIVDSARGAIGVEPSKQSEAIVDAAVAAKNRIASLPVHGRRVSRFVEAVMSRLESRLHDPSKMTRFAGSVRIQWAELDEELRVGLRAAVDYGVLCPWPFDEHSAFPSSDHQYWVSHEIAAAHWMLLRKGESMDAFNLLMEGTSESQLALDFGALD